MTEEKKKQFKEELELANLLESLIVTYVDNGTDENTWEDEYENDSGQTIVEVGKEVDNYSETIIDYYETAVNIIRAGYHKQIK